MKIGLMAYAFGCALGLGSMLSIPAYAQDSKLHWYKGNTHTHTKNSDGDSAPDAVVRWYRENGYQFLFITDHEYMTDVAPLNALLGATDRFLVLPGQEISQSISLRTPGSDLTHLKESELITPHVNALFTSKTILPICADPDCSIGPVDSSVSVAKTFDTNIGAVLKQGGIAQINHPNFLWSVKPSDLDNIPDGTLLEIWNGQNLTNNLGGDDGNGDRRPSVEGIWDHALSRGKIVWGVGVDDSHLFKGTGAIDPGVSAAGQAWIMVRASELTPEAIKSSIETGNFYASTGVTLAKISNDTNSLTVMIKEPERRAPRYLTHFIGQDGKVLAEVAGINPSYRFKGSETYVRAKITDSNGKQAWTQPIFLDGRSQR